MIKQRADLPSYVATHCSVLQQTNRLQKAQGCRLQRNQKEKKKRNILSLSLTIGGVVTDQFTPCTLAIEVQVQALPSRRLSFHPGV